MVSFNWAEKSSTLYGLLRPPSANPTAIVQEAPVAANDDDFLESELKPASDPLEGRGPATRGDQATQPDAGRPGPVAEAEPRHPCLSADRRASRGGGLYNDAGTATLSRPSSPAFFMHASV